MDIAFLVLCNKFTSWYLSIICQQKLTVGHGLPERTPTTYFFFFFFFVEHCDYVRLQPTKILHFRLLLLVARTREHYRLHS